ncbi:MAG: HEAT repeat domain-containing protein [Candidatus Competibacteraceae bacterium]
MNRELDKYVREWKSWSKGASRMENGWQSDFTNWEDLIYYAKSAMTQEPDAADLENIEFCWYISEESEELADFAIDYMDKVWQVIEFLAQSQFVEVRIQVYKVLGEAGPRAEKILRHGLHDSDSYCRRIAILSLSKLSVPDSGELALSFVYDVDPYTRQASLQLAKAANNPKLESQVREILLKDKVEHVRNAASA